MLLRYFGFLISMTLERASNLQVITHIEPGILRRRFRQFSPMDALKVQRETGGDRVPSSVYVSSFTEN